MTSDGRRPLHVVADLSIDLDGVPVEVRATGADLRVVTGDVRRLLTGARALAGAATPASSGRGELKKVARTLAERGLTASLDGPSGLVATVGAGIDSRTGLALLGTRHVRLHPVGVARAGGPWVAAAVVLVAGVVLRRRARHRSARRVPAATG